MKSPEISFETPKGNTRKYWNQERLKSALAKTWKSAEFLKL